MPSHLTIIIKIIFFVSFILLYYIYDGYYRFLCILSYFHPAHEAPFEFDANLPTITVLVTVFNEEVNIERKIFNLLECEYPQHLLEILVASDGSTDKTDEIVQQMSYPCVKLFRPSCRKGKTATQNQAINLATGNIILFTDAVTVLDPFFLKNIVQYFSCPQVGLVDGHLLFIHDLESGISKSQSYYWEFELRLRQIESRLNILAVASGACMAVRRRLIRPMEAEYGEDCVIPLDVVIQGQKVLHASDAIAYDRMEHDWRKEFKTRVRMTTRNFQGTYSRKALLNPLHYPGYALALWSHKMLRWFSPVLLSIINICALIMVDKSFYWNIILVSLVIFYVTGFLGFFVEKHRWSIPVVKIIYSFLLANAGFIVGLIRVGLRHRITTYRS